MKKAVSFFCVVLIGLGGILTPLGSKSPYVTEARFWKARAFSQQIVANPETTPPLVFKKARQQFEGLIRDYPENIALKKECLLSIAGLLVQEKKYQEARDFLYKVGKEYLDDSTFGAKSQFLIGFSYEKGGDWAAALKEYGILRDHYSTSPLGLEAPLYIARHDIKEDSQKGKESYEAAAEYYRRVAQKNPKSPVNFVALNDMLMGYEEQKEWGKSLDTVEEIILAYPTALRVYVPRIEAYSRKLNQPERAGAIYQAFIQANPESKDAALLKKRIEGLERKQENVSQ